MSRKRYVPEPLSDEELTSIRDASNSRTLEPWTNHTVQRLIATIDHLNLLLGEERAGEDI